jgi:hypothetical protein
MDVGSYTDADVTQEDLSLAFSDYFTWTINSSSLYLNWSDPTILRIFNDEAVFPTDYNIVALDVRTVHLSSQSLPESF